MNDKRVKELMDQRDTIDRALLSTSKAINELVQITAPADPQWYGCLAAFYSATEKLAQYAVAVNNVLDFYLGNEEAEVS
jgi:hypothetical protein